MTVRSIPLKDLTGQKFGRWTVIEEAPHRKSGNKTKRCWFCRCDCGIKREVPQRGLLDGTSQSCGCYNREQSSKRHKTHGLSNTREFKTWASMMSRCSDPNATAYNKYGGRGIKVCDRWDKFENFLLDMGNRPDNHTIDRIDNDGDYEPGNCRWATQKQQINNRSNTLKVEYHGKMMSCAEISEIIGVPRQRIYLRVKQGWPIEDVIGLPKNTKKKYFESLRAKAMDK